jgi:hypothetical protein
MDTKQILAEINKADIETLKNYLTGALHDGSLTTGHRVKFFQRNKAWITQIIQPCLETAYNLTFRPKAVYWDTTKWVLHFGHQQVWKDLSQRRKRNLKHLHNETVVPYIRAFWDTDGGCPRYPSIQRKLYIDFTQKDANILKTVKDILNQYGITTGNIRKSERKPTGDIHRFAITGKPGMLLFIKTISSWHPVKRPRLEKMRQLIEANANSVT